jgi:hypothetical protein
LVSAGAATALPHKAIQNAHVFLHSYTVARERVERPTVRGQSFSTHVFNVFARRSAVLAASGVTLERKSSAESGATFARDVFRDQRTHAFPHALRSN